jgi:hypothetical protein
MVGVRSLPVAAPLRAASVSGKEATATGRYRWRRGSSKGVTGSMNTQHSAASK